MTGLSLEASIVLVACLASLATLARGRSARSRDRIAINRALHELRRPLQAMALLLPEYSPRPARPDLGVVDCRGRWVPSRSARRSRRSGISTVR